jgi:hypothetical protein
MMITLMMITMMIKTTRATIKEADTGRKSVSARTVNKTYLNGSHRKVP